MDDKDLERIKETLRKVQSSQSYQCFIIAALFAPVTIVSAR
jgi:hypothetical protein